MRVHCIAATFEYRKIMSYLVGVVDPNRTYSLRQRVLRPDETLASVAQDNEFDGAITFGASESEDGEILSTSTIYREDPPTDLTPIAQLAAVRPAWRLRAVATDEHLRSAGLGRLVLNAVISHITENDDAVLWCYARVPARNFYLREGFLEFGEIFPIPKYGPHIVMYRSLDRKLPR
jgi:GNAT superfamily N-acetyltransferase